ncbi:MAG: zf-HC2 domain-containing protein [Armatimonadota bacterium]|nr:zf-HC2 domain-containing protein [Armatimonadota bacterium]MDR7445256.1 zf-HC2 domain-containing protein [Armatimonadota bacterium]MDR7614758.1 zf-HC2 domain-containing protein [Armatimonadota bacterium]
MTTDHERLRRLLPWYAAGTLEGAEAAAVEEHLAGCPRCRHEMQSCLQLRRSLQNLSSSLPPPPPEVLSRTWTRILRHERERGRPGFARYAGLIAALAAAWVVAVAGVVPHPGPFVTLGVARRESSPVLQVVFHPGTTEAEIRALLQEIGGTIEEGPRASGLYRIRLSRDTDPDRAVERLRRDRAVLFAELEP